MAKKTTKAERSRIMACVKAKDTRPEMLVRRMVHGLGYRFRLHRRDLPGTPDIVLPRLRKIINVHGCFWHLHKCKHGQRAPVDNAEYWSYKRERNFERDGQNLRKLRRGGWHVLTLWECQMRDVNNLRQRIAAFLAD